MDVLAEQFRHHTWATLNLIDFCAELSPNALSMTVPGTAGAVVQMLVHLVAAEQRYLERLPVARFGRMVREGMEPPLSELRDIFAEQAKQWESIVARRAELNVVMPPRPGDNWPDTPHAEVLLMLQCLHHGNDHRTHIATVLGAHGHQPPDLDGWAYWEAVHHRLA